MKPLLWLRGDTLRRLNPWTQQIVERATKPGSTKTMTT